MNFLNKICLVIILAKLAILSLILNHLHQKYPVNANFDISYVFLCLFQVPLCRTVGQIHQRERAVA